MKNKTVIVAVFVLLASVLPAAANVMITVKASQGDQIATQQFVVSTGWSLPTSIALVGTGGAQLGTIKMLDVLSNDDPYVNLHFSVEAGALDTTFDINSSLVSSIALVNPDSCFATAGVTLTSDENGASITGLFAGRTYQARYNGGNVYANLVNGYSIAPDETVTASERSPAIGGQTILGSVSSIQSEFNFVLSANEQASGTSRFEVAMLPEPATLSLIALGAIGMLRRRRLSAAR
jgi:hypothetical protein